MIKYLLPLTLLFSFFSSPPCAQAQAFQGLQIEAGIELPTQISARLKAIFNNQFYISGGLGYSPSFMTDQADSVTMNVESEDSFLMSKSMSGGFSIDLRAGWQQAADQGFYIEGGYSYLSNGAGEVEEADVENFLLINLPSFSQRSIDVETSLHSLTLHAGYQLPISDKLQVKFEGGIIKPIKSENSLSPNEGPSISTYIQDEYNDEMKSAWSSAYIFTLGAHLVLDL